MYSSKTELHSKAWERGAPMTDPTVNEQHD